jgi:hypothetical protein
MNELLERSIAAIDRHADSGTADVDRLVGRLHARRVRRKSIGAACVALMLGSGALVTEHQVAQSRFVTASGAIDAGGLAMEGNAGDFFELDPSVVPEGWQRKLNRDVIKLGVCLTVEDRAGEPVCTETEGPSNLAQVDYYAPGNTSNASAGNQSDDSSAQALSVETIHTAIGIDDYVKPWGQRGAETFDPHATAEKLVVRGHDARAYISNGPKTPAVTWLEAPGLIVTVSGLNVEQSLVNRVAEAINVIDVQRLPVPVVAATAKAVASEEITNDRYLLVRHDDGRECAGFGYIEGCSQSASSRTGVVYAPTGYVALGKTAASVTTVDALASDGRVLASAPTTGVVGFTSRFFNVASGDTPPASIVARDANGRIVERLALNDPPLRPSKLPELIDGVKVAIISFGTNPPPDVPRLRLTYVPARTAEGDGWHQGCRRQLFRRGITGRKLSVVRQAGTADRVEVGERRSGNHPARLEHRSGAKRHLRPELQQQHARRPVSPNGVPANQS